jgi:hypothetical protein
MTTAARGNERKPWQDMSGQDLAEWDWSYNGCSYEGFVKQLAALHPDPNADQLTRVLWADRELRTARADSTPIEQRRLLADYLDWRQGVLA